ncbi:Uncharacterized protein FKW44_013510 [Caligus rogercresseyi]|uniref:Uncharacterized protein n=1 Tax=Caligus rogercresseyi TaxID=217165 RepID=A0A7T8GXL7_CALRO|nr:Uncharacterized protein FKW44_013510 [Caligus rogercresseyi]
MTMIEFTEKKSVARTTVSNAVKEEIPKGRQQTWMEDNIKFWTKDFWPPQSPDLNLLDYSVCPPWQWQGSEGLRRQGVGCHERCNVANVSIAFWRRVEVVIKAEGGHTHK